MAIPEILKTIALNRLVDQGVRRIDRFYGTDTDKEDDDKGFGFVSQQRPGGLGSIIGRALAFSLLGPIAGPLAFAAGRGLLSRQQQGLGFSPFGGDGPSSAGIVSDKAVTLDGDIVDVGSSEYYDDLDARDKEFAETGDYDVYSNTVTTGPNYGPVTSGTVFDAEDDGGGDIGGFSQDAVDAGIQAAEDDNGDSGGTGTMDASDFSDDTAGTPFRYGGLASLYR